jgi:hypothetical protein
LPHTVPPWDTAVPPGDISPQGRDA